MQKGLKRQGKKRLLERLRKSVQKRLMISREARNSLRRSVSFGFSVGETKVSGA